MRIMLDDNWSYTTNNHEDFCKAIEAIDSATTVLPDVKAADMEFINLREIHQDRAIGNVITERTFRELESTLVLNGRKRAVIPFDRFSREIARDVYRNNRLLLKTGKYVCAISSGCMAAIAKKAGVKGDILNSKSITLPLALIEGMVCREYSSEYGLQFVIRTDKVGTSKIFGVFSGKSSVSKNALVTDTVDKILNNQKFQKMGVDAVDAYVDHFTAMERVEFTSLSESLSEQYGLRDIFYIGLMISSSQTGHGNYELVATLRNINHDSYITFPLYNMKHCKKEMDGEVSEDLVMEAIEQVSAVMKRMAEKQALVVDSVNVLDQYISTSGISELIGKKRTKQHMEDVTEKYEGKEVTQYDMLQELMLMPEEAGELCKYTMRKIMEMCGDLVAA